MPNRLLAAAALVVLLPVAAQAGCLYKPFDFHPEKNDGVVVTSIVDAGSSCTHNFGEGPGYKFTGITVARAPDHGKLAQAGASRFIYTPDKSFTGKDAYLFRICATKGKAKGCSTVAFVPEVK
ncbi:MAG: Ig-like domain-containing protein [Pseudolabrys sp.]